MGGLYEAALNRWNMILFDCRKSCMNERVMTYDKMDYYQDLQT